MIGGKTGFTKKSGRCLVSVAERDGLRLIAVTLNAPDDWRDHATLYDFGFDNYEIRKIPPTNLSLPVISGKKDTINLTSSELSIFISKNANIITKVEIPRWIFAPVHEGEKIGNVVYYLNGKKVASSHIIATEAIEQMQPKFNFFDWLFNILKGLTKWNK